jgi:DNA polymerase I
VNVQNIPRSDKVVKKAFYPKQDALLFFDYKQIEPRLLGYYMAVACGDTRLVDGIKAGVDPYTTIVRGLYGRDDITEDERDHGKKLFLSLQYGGGVKTVITQWRVEFPVAKRMVDEFHAAWPSIRMLNDQINRTVQERGFIRSITGRHLRPESEHKAVNSLCQGSAAELMRRALVLVDEFCSSQLLASHLVLTIHDELVLDATKTEIPYLVEHIPTLMDFPLVSEVVPITTDVEISFGSWADKQDYQEVLLAS